LKGGQSVQQRAVAQLTLAAVQWARGNPAQPRPDVVWQQLWEMLWKEGLIADRFGDDSEE
jgi:hypothetical protein